MNSNPSPNPTGRPPHVTDWRTMYMLRRLNRRKKLGAWCDARRAADATDRTCMPDDVYFHILRVMRSVVFEDQRRAHPRITDLHTQRRAS